MAGKELSTIGVDLIREIYSLWVGVPWVAILYSLPDRNVSKSHYFFFLEFSPHLTKLFLQNLFSCFSDWKSFQSASF